MGRPPATPIGLQLARTARIVTTAFERAMAEAGGSASTWQVLLLVRSQQWSNQAQMADAMGITGATLTHHLNAAEDHGLVRRWREPGNRRVQHAELTDAGLALFDRLREVAVRHDARLRARLAAEEVQLLSGLLDKLLAGLAPADADAEQAAPPA